MVELARLVVQEAAHVLEPRLLALLEQLELLVLFLLVDAEAGVFVAQLLHFRRARGR